MQEMNLKGENRPALYSFLCIVGLVVITFAVYYGTLANGFVSDDNRQIIGNPWITGLEYLPEIFTQHSFGFKKTGGAAITFRPMVFVLYMLQYALFGLDAWGWHLVNVLLHAANAVMVYLVVGFLLQDVRRGPPAASTRLAVYLPPFVAALIFATHPVNTEVVAWVGCQPEQFYTLLCLVAFLIHIRGRAHMVSDKAGLPRTLFYLLVPPAVFFVAVLFKEAAIALPVLVFIYDWTKEKGERPLSPRRMVRYAPYVAAGAMYFAIRVNALGHIVPPVGYNHYLNLSATQYVLNGFALFARYLKSLVAPVGEYPFQAFEPILSISEPAAFLSILLTLSIPVALLLFRRREVTFYLLLLSLAFVVLPLLPSLYAIGINQSPFATRYLYFSTVGLVIFLGMVTCRALLYGGERKKAWISWGVVVVFVASAAFYSAWSAERGGIWRNQRTMWEASLKGSRGNYLAVFAIGVIHFQKGRIDEAIKTLNHALALNTERAHPDPNIILKTRKVLATAYRRKGLVDSAINEYNIILGIKPNNPTANFNLAILYKKKGMYEEAIAQFKRTQLYAEEPWQFRDIHVNLAESYAATGRWPEAVKSYEDALKYVPGDPVIMLELKRAQAMAGPG
jgi:tetratricopeptide (TPR) repeat protein